jgi:hypothetical protein
MRSNGMAGFLLGIARRAVCATCGVDAAGYRDAMILLFCRVMS